MPLCCPTAAPTSSSRPPTRAATTSSRTWCRASTPLAGYPDATDPARVLYTVHFGAIPGVGDPPNYGDDPYVATRGDERVDDQVRRRPGRRRRRTRPPSARSLTGADASLDVMAFGGPGILRSLLGGRNERNPDPPRQRPARTGDEGVDRASPIRRRQARCESSSRPTASHFVFGSEDKFEPAGNSASVSIYDRDLVTDAHPGRVDDAERVDDDRRGRRARHLRRWEPDPDRQMGRDRLRRQ